jgi:hypothetical protein
MDAEQFHVFRHEAVHELMKVGEILFPTVPKFSVTTENRMIK